MNILMINKYFDAVGGIEDTFRNLSSINDPDISVVVIAASSKQTVPFPSGVRAKISKTWFTALSVPFAPGVIISFIKEVRAADIIHIHIPSFIGEMLVFFALPFIGRRKLVVTYHADIVRQKFFILLYDRLVKLILRRATVICPTSPRLVEHSRLLRNFAGTYCIIPSAVVCPGWDIAAKDYGRRTYALFVGRLIYYKGIETLVDAIAGTNIPLVIVGDGPLRASLEQKTAERGIADQITFQGFIPDERLAAIYADATFFVFPSLYATEAFGLTQVTAMMYGLPVINTDLPTGVPWVARDGHEAITVRPGDSGALKNAMMRLWDDASLRMQTGYAGRRRASAEFSMDTMVERYRALYHDIMRA